MKLVRLFLLVFVAVFSLGQILRLELGQINVLFIDLLIFIFNLVSAICFRKQKKKLPDNLKYYYLLTLFLGLSFLLNLYGKSGQEIIFAGLYLLRLINYAVFSILFATTVKTAKLKSREVIEYILYSILFMAIFGIVQYLFMPDMRYLYYLGWDDHYFRLVGSLFDPNFSGLVFIFGIIIILVYYRNKILQIKRINNYQIFLIFLAFALMATFSRGSWLTAGVVLSLFFIREANKKVILSFIGMFILVVLLLPKPLGEGVNLLRTSTIQARIVNYQEALSVISKNYLTGVGFNFLSFYKQKQTPNPSLMPVSQIPTHSAAGFDNSFLFTWAVGGILSMLALILFLLKNILKKGIGKIHPYVLYLTVAIIIHMFFYNSFYYPHIIIPYLMLLAITEIKGRTRGNN